MAITEQTIQKVWAQARGTTELNAEVWRKDECGAWIRREHYGHPHSEFGWKIENVSLGGPDTPENLRAFHHANAFDRANRRSHCRMTADQTHLPATEYVREPRNREA